MKDQNIQKSEEDNIESSNSSDQYNIIQIIVVVKLSGDQAEGKTKEGGGGDLGSERPLLHRPTLI